MPYVRSSWTNGWYSPLVFVFSSHSFWSASSPNQYWRRNPSFRRVWIGCSLYCDSLKLNRVSEVNDAVGFLCSDLRTALEFQDFSKWIGVWKPTEKLFFLSFFNVEIRPVYIQWKKNVLGGQGTLQLPLPLPPTTSSLPPIVFPKSFIFFPFRALQALRFLGRREKCCHIF